jgi:hypothetical protein
MWWTSARIIRSIHVKGHRPWVYVRLVFLLQLLSISFMHNNELNTDKTNDAYIIVEESSTYKLLLGLWTVLMHRHPNIEVMRFNPSNSRLQYRIQCYKHVYI